jgi:hypothetical protein
MKDARIVALPPEDPAVVPAASAHSDPGSPPFGVPAAAKQAQSDSTVPKEPPPVVPCWVKVLQIAFFGAPKGAPEGLRQGSMVLRRCLAPDPAPPRGPSSRGPSPGSA